jgi:hypothetical protein
MQPQTTRNTIIDKRSHAVVFSRNFGHESILGSLCSKRSHARYVTTFSFNISCIIVSANEVTFLLQNDSLIYLNVTLVSKDWSKI